jgi:hypothetical protein
MIVGYGSGDLAILDAAARQKVGNIKLPPIPRGSKSNLPMADQMGAIDTSSGKIIGRWGSWLAAGNFPMALDDASGRLFSGYRWPASLVTIDIA